MPTALDRFLTRVRDLLGAPRTSAPTPQGGSRTARQQGHPPQGTSASTGAGTGTGPHAGTGTGAGTTAYPGDATALPTMTYAPRPDGRPDPGEIVWTWVPYEEDHSQGKDRPVLVIGREGDWLVALQLTSKDHDR
ncbi:MAG: type II toxin-antitoxin system PemK/MazF family toxin, partial [Humibacillus sp.]